MNIQRLFPITEKTHNFAVKSYMFIGIILISQLCFCLANWERPSSNYGEQMHDNHKRHRKNEGLEGNNKQNRSEVVIEAVEIPYPVKVGETIQMKCIWRLGKKIFYSVRWYKNGDQFYSYIKGEKPNFHPRTGVQVVVDETDERAITLTNITHDSEGEYSCEVMTDGPPFSTTKHFANLTVVEQSEVPQFHGLHDDYKVGDTLNVTCRSANGRPAPTLTVKVNGVPIREKSGRLIEYKPLKGDRPNVFTSETRLLLPLSTSYLPQFTLGCYASTHGLTVQKEVAVRVNQRSSLFFFSSTSSGNAVHPPGAKVTCIGSLTLLLATLFFY